MERITAAGPEYGGGIQYTSGRRGNVWSVGLAFLDLSVAYAGEKVQHDEQQC